MNIHVARTPHFRTRFTHTCCQGQTGSLTVRPDTARCTGLYKICIGQYWNAAEGRQRRQWTPAKHSKNGTWTVWGRLGSVGRALAGFLQSIVRPSALSCRPPPTSNDRPPSRTLTERSSGVPPKTLQIFDMSKTLRNPLRPLTTTNDL